MVAQVVLLGDGVVQNLHRCTGSADLPFDDDIGAVGDRERLADAVVGDQDADAAVLQVADDLLNIGDDNRIDAGKRLVEEDEGGDQ